MKYILEDKCLNCHYYSIAIQFLYVMISLNIGSNGNNNNYSCIIDSCLIWSLLCMTGTGLCALHILKGLILHNNSMY